MQISAIKPYITPETYKKIYNTNKNQDVTLEKQQENAPNVQLADIHYNRLLVKPKSDEISFKGVQQVGKVLPSVIKSIPFEERLASLVEIIDTNDLIVAAKNKKTANKFLNESIDAFNRVIKRVFFLPEEKIPEAIAISRSDVAPELINLGDAPILVTNLEGKNYAVGKKAGVWITPEATVNLNNKFHFSVKERSKENLSFMRAEFSEPYNFTEFVQPSIVNVNKRTFKNIFLDDVQAAKFGLADVGGMDSVVKELKKNILYPIKKPEAFLNRKVNHGIILYGPPGTGKTFVAKALANDAGANYYEINAGSLRGGLVGQTEANWRNLFKEAVDNQPSILLIDECDAVFKTRSALQPYAADELNQILALISDLEKNNDQVFVISTTNRPELLDDAVLRAGRLGKQIEIPVPDFEGIKDIFSKQLKKVNVEKKFNINNFAKKLHENKLTGSDTNQVIDNAYDIAYDRLGVFDKIEQGTFDTNDIKNLVLTSQDFEKGLEKHLAQNLKASGKTKRRPIGFTAKDTDTSASKYTEIKQQKLNEEPQVAAMG